MFNPQKKLLDGIRLAFPLQMFPWDQYFPEMAEADYLDGDGETIAVKSFFVRKMPFGGSYALLGGITEALRTICDLDFSDPDFQRGLADSGIGEDFIDNLTKKKKLRVKVYTPQEGSVIFQNEPFVTIVGPLPDVRLVEGILTEALNFGILSMTKWYRFVRTIRPGQALDFSRRRAQNHLKAALYAILAGVSRTSNSELRRFFDAWLAGTMGHEWIQKYGDVLLAFRRWLQHKPHKPIGLVDTLQCMEFDFPFWLIAVYENRDSIKKANPVMWGWRNDSGDLAFLTIEQYRVFMKHELARDSWFKDKMRIILTNDLDEYSANEIIQQITTQAKQAGFDSEDILHRIIWASGTKPGTCSDQPALGGVAKLMEVYESACIKLAFDAEGKPGDKTSIPGFNFSALVLDKHDEVKATLIYPARKYAINEAGLLVKDGKIVSRLEMINPLNSGSIITFEEYRLVPKQKLVYDSLDGSGFTEEWDDPTLTDVTRHITESVDQLHWTVTRLVKPEVMKVMVTPDLYELRHQMIKQGVLREDFLRIAA